MCIFVAEKQSKHFMATIKILSVDDEAPMELLIKQYFRRITQQNRPYCVQCFHFAKNFNFLNYFVWQSYRKSHGKAPTRPKKCCRG